MDTFITEQFETPRHMPAASVYRAYEQECRKRGLTALSARAFYQRIKQRATPEQTEAREGARAAYPEQPWFWEITETDPPAWQSPVRGGPYRSYRTRHPDPQFLDRRGAGQALGHVHDGCLLSASARCLPDVRSALLPLGDDGSCAFVCSVLSASPNLVVVDGGREFQSVYFDSLLARYRCTKKTRPWAKPHFGSVCERLFKTTNDQFIYTLLGNTQAAKRARLLTRAVDPKHHALWMLPDLYSYLCEYAYQVYDQNEHSGIGMTPQAAYLWGRKQGGEREHRRIPYNDRFLKATCPTTTKGTAVVQKGSGVKMNHFYYWNNAFRNPDVIKTAVPGALRSFRYFDGLCVRCKANGSLAAHPI